MKRSTHILLGITLFCCSILSGQEYDLLIQGGHLIDPKNGIDQIMDVAIKEGKIAAVEKKINSNKSKKTINAKGLLVSPGLIDIHGHHFHGTEQSRYLSNSFTALPPDGFTFESGITTVVDVGGAGWRNFEQFKNQTIHGVNESCIHSVRIGRTGNTHMMHAKTRSLHREKFAKPPCRDGHFWNYLHCM